MLPVETRKKIVRLRFKRCRDVTAACAPNEKKNHHNLVNNSNTYFITCQMLLPAKLNCQIGQPRLCIENNECTQTKER